MKKRIWSVALLSSLMLSACGTTQESSLSSAFGAFAKLLDRTSPLVQESQEWEQYSQQKIEQGVTYHTGTAADKQFVSKKMDAEYPSAIDRLSKPFAISKQDQKELDEANQGYHFKYNQVMTVKDKKTASTLGYCVNYDVNRWENGKPTALDAPGNLQQHFIYVATDKPVSASTINKKFVRTMCGESFYNKYKNPETYKD